MPARFGMAVWRCECHFLLAILDPCFTPVRHFMLVVEVPNLGGAGCVGDVLRHLLPRLVEDFDAAIVPFWSVAAGVAASPGMKL